MDPTEIVLVPYDLQRLGIYVLGATFVSIISSENDLIWIKTLLMLQWTAIAFIAIATVHQGRRSAQGSRDQAGSSAQTKAVTGCSFRTVEYQRRRAGRNE